MNSEQNKLLGHYYYKDVLKKSISSPKSFSQKKKQYKNQNIKKIITQIQYQYQSYREVRGDGNCFYRALIILYIQHQLIYDQISGNQNILKICGWLEQNILLNQSIPELYIKNYKINHMKQVLKIALDQLIFQNNYLRQCFSQNKQSIKQEIRKYLTFLLNHHPFLDFILIVAIRCKIYESYKKNKDNEKIRNYLLQNEEIMIKQYGYQAENLIINFGSLALDYKLIIISIQNILNKYEIDQIEGKNNKAIHLFYRKGHYDICYLRQSKMKKNVNLCIRCQRNQRQEKQEKEEKQNQIKLLFCKQCFKLLQKIDLKNIYNKCQLCGILFDKKQDQICLQCFNIFKYIKFNKFIIIKTKFICKICNKKFYSNQGISKKQNQHDPHCFKCFKQYYFYKDVKKCTIF